MIYLMEVLLLQQLCLLGTESARVAVGQHVEIITVVLLVALHLIRQIILNTKYKLGIIL